MNLIIDIGNTLVKLAVFEQNKLIETVCEENFSKNTIDRLIQQYNIQKGIYSTVRDEHKVNELLKNYNFLNLDHTTPLPLELVYKTPETLGLDRIAAVVGAKTQLEEGGNFMVVDMGTCITYDVVNANNKYLGGAISPGLNMRFKALNSFTGKLPLINYRETLIELTGDSTENAILSGVYNGIAHEIKGFINSYMKQYDDLKIVITGGDANLFDLEPKNRIFADKFLVLKGLNEILLYNEEK